MQNTERVIGQGAKRNLFKLIVNEKGEYIYLDDKDPGIFDRFADFLKWLDDQDLRIKDKKIELQQKYGNGVLKRNENGGVMDIEIDAIVEMSKFQMNTYREAADRINKIFGGDILQKYFHVSYENNPDFVPGDECLFDFLEEMIPVLNDIFSDARERIKTKYSSDRKGGKKTKYRTGK